MKFLIGTTVWEIEEDHLGMFDIYKNGSRRFKGLPTVQTAHAMILNEYRLDE